MDLLAGLNPVQREAVETIEGPVLVLAGPGSGKTRVITHRVAYLIQVCGVSPRRIMAVTFTNKAAREMKERLYRLLAGRVEELTLGTFHAICARILRQEAPHLGLDRNFVIYDEDDQLSLVKRAEEEVGLDPKQYAPRAILSAISAAKSVLLAPEDYGKPSRSYFDEIVRRVYQRYQELLTESKALDFDDLLMKPVFLFRQEPEVLARYQNRYLHLLIDEFQDTNVAQYVLAQQLAGKYKNIFVVGDPDQSIYSWRSADLRNILYFERDYPQVKTVYLEQNYRSTKTILEAARHVIAPNVERKELKLWTENETGSPITVVETYNEEEEAHFVVNEVETLRRSGAFGLGDCAVMYRTNAQSRALEEAFLRYGLPHKLVGATRFYERREVKDILAYLRVIHDPYDSVSLSRIINVPPRGIGPRTVNELTRWAHHLGLPLYAALQTLAEAKGQDQAETISLPSHSFTSRTVAALTSFLARLNDFMAQAQERDVLSLLDLAVERLHYREYLAETGDQDEERWGNVLELRTVAAEHQDLTPQEGLASFLESVSLVSDVDNLNEKVNAVTLITLHQAKGLEFPVVFIVGLEEKVFPHAKSFDDPSQMEEERRLCYVGLTRAKQKLYLVRAFRRRLMGSSTPNPPSRFLKDVPAHLVTLPGHLAEAKARASTWGQALPGVVPGQRANLPDLKAGDRVRHAKFGDGVVVTCSVTKDDSEVIVAFKGGVGIKKLLLSLAPLEKA